MNTNKPFMEFRSLLKTDRKLAIQKIHILYASCFHLLSVDERQEEFSKLVDICQACLGVVFEDEKDVYSFLVQQLEEIDEELERRGKCQ